MTHASLCTGIGACELAATWLGWKNLFSCEIDEFCNKILKHHYPKARHYGNIFEQDFREWRGRVDVLTAGFPCQPFSCAGKRNGAEDDRYLWPEVLRVIDEVRPTWFIGENVTGIISMVFPGEEITVGRYTDTTGESYKETEMRQQFIIDRICNDLECINYSVQPVVIPACAVGTPHRRDRVWFIASNRGSAGFQTQETEQQATGIIGDGLQRYVTDPERIGSHKVHENIQPEQPNGTIIDSISSERADRRCITMPNWEKFPTQSLVCGRDDGISTGLSGITFSKWRQQSIKALGNSMVPQVVYEIFRAIESVEFSTK